MVLIDSPTDLMATASRHFPASSDSTSFQNWETDYDYYDGRDYQDEPRLSLSDLYLKGAYEKRVQDLEAFAKDKNFWASYNGLQKKVEFAHSSYYPPLEFKEFFYRTNQAELE